MTDKRPTVAYIFATAIGITVAYHAGKLIGFNIGYKRGRSEARALEDQPDHYLGWGDVDEWH